MSRRKLLQLVLAILVLGSVVVLPASAGAPALRYETTRAVWVRYYPLRGEHWSYGVFIVPNGARNLQVIYQMKDGRWFAMDGGSQCRVNPVNGPGYINDPEGMNSAYVPKGYTGMAICASTKWAVYLATVMRQDMWNSSRWILAYERD